MPRPESSEIVEAEGLPRHLAAQRFDRRGVAFERARRQIVGVVGADQVRRAFGSFGRADVECVGLGQALGRTLGQARRQGADEHEPPHERSLPESPTGDYPAPVRRAR